MQLISCSSPISHIKPIPDLAALSNTGRVFLDTVSIQLAKAKNVATTIFKEHKTAVTVSLAVTTIAFQSPLSLLTTIVAGIALVTINVSAALDKTVQRSINKTISPLDGTKGIWAVIKAIALTTLKEMVALIAISAASAFFITDQIGLILLVAGAATSLCVNLCFRIVSGATFLICAERDSETHERKMPEGKAKKIIDFVEFLAPLSYSFAHFNTFDTVIHEGGHALAAKLLYKNLEPEIVVFPYEGGATRFIPTTLSRIGSFFGANKANAIIAAAGPIAAVGTATAELIVAERIEETHPRLSRYLKILGCVNIASHLVYAYSALDEATSAATANPLSGHDFVRLWSKGIHPYMSMVGMVALPLIVKTGIYIYEKTTKLPVEASSIE